jgi:hypothetical protein
MLILPLQGMEKRNRPPNCRMAGRSTSTPARAIPEERGIDGMWLRQLDRLAQGRRLLGMEHVDLRQPAGQLGTSLVVDMPRREGCHQRTELPLAPMLAYAVYNAEMRGLA